MNERYLTQDLDYYKATMTQVEHATLRHESVTFELINRGLHQLSEYVTPTQLRERLTYLQKGWTPEEIAALAGHKHQDGSGLFNEQYLDYIADHALPAVDISLDERGELLVRTTGDAPLVSFWETAIMAELNELYYENYMRAHGLSLDELYERGDALLSDKIALLSQRPDIQFADFGTRRRFSYRWHEHVVQRLSQELPGNFVGTSNIYMAHMLGLTPVGTFAHEMPMVYAAIEEQRGGNPLDGHDKMLRDWETFYRGDLSIALTDTFTSEYFFDSITKDQADSWKGLRHDSGDPIEFGEKAIRMYESHSVDPSSKLILFSDGLDVPTMIKIADHFKGRIRFAFGIGTNLTNDLGVPRNNFVMKAVRVNETGTVKLSDTAGKHTGETRDVERYLSYVQARVGRSALAGASRG